MASVFLPAFLPIAIEKSPFADFPDADPTPAPSPITTVPYPGVLVSEPITILLLLAVASSPIAIPPYLLVAPTPKDILEEGPPVVEFFPIATPSPVVFEPVPIATASFPPVPGLLTP